MKIEKKINVLSLFDGMSCGQIALKKLGINVGTYYASEIDNHAKLVALANFPETVQLGDVRGVEVSKLKKIDLLIGGSPCQGFSFAGKQLNFSDPRSKLFFEFVRILNEARSINPDVKFMLENVRMKKEYLDVISQHLGVQPVKINSNILSAQNRIRYYWTNISDVKQPADKNINLKDIIHESEKNQQSESSSKDLVKKCLVSYEKSLKILERCEQQGKMGYFRSDSQANRVYYINGKSICLCGDAGGGAAKMGQYFFGVVQQSRGKNGGGLLKDLKKCPTITSNAWEQNTSLMFGVKDFGLRKLFKISQDDGSEFVLDGYIRKLTPIECERLQTVPDNYTNHVSDTQRYKMLGNGWTVDVIVHVLSQIKN